eukprot:8607900-Heterocapsa_arctica.AAC.1
MKSTLASDHRLIGASIGWGRKKTIHVICMYGLDTGQTDPGPEEGNRLLRDRVSEHLAKLGRVPWIIGGDWNVEPGTFTLEKHSGKAGFVATTGHTYSRDGNKSNLDWFLVCSELIISAQVFVNNDTHIQGHSPVRMAIGGKLSEDMGSRIRRPMDFQGMTRKEAKNNMPTDGVFKLEGKNIDGKWRKWNEASENYLAHKEGKTGEDYFGRGKPIQYVKNTISAPQDNADGSAI